MVRLLNITYNLIYSIKITFLGEICLIESDFFVISCAVIRNKSPPLNT